MSDTFKPSTSTRTKKVETLASGVVIYSHTAKHVKGSFIAARGDFDWAAAETIEEARELGAKL